MAKFEMQWTIDIEIPDEVLAKKTRAQIKDSLQRLIASGAVSEFNQQIEEWMDVHKGKEVQPVLPDPFEGILSNPS